MFGLEIFLAQFDALIKAISSTVLMYPVKDAIFKTIYGRSPSKSPFSYKDIIRYQLGVFYFHRTADIRAEKKAHKMVEKEVNREYRKRGRKLLRI